MRWFAQIVFRLKSLFSKRKLDEEISEEVRTHVDLATEANVVAGMTPEDARYAALREFGNVASIQERTRDEHGWVWLEQCWQDLRYAVRQLRRSPGFALAVVLTLALGIGVSTAVFSIVDALLLRPKPVRAASEVWSIMFRDPEHGGTNPNISYPFYCAYRDGTTAFADFFGFAGARVTLREGVERNPAYGQLVTGNYFSGLGVTPALGRLLVQEDDEAPERIMVAVISHEFWQSRMGGSAEVLGQSLVVNDVKLTIVGVAPVGFNGLNGFRGVRLTFWAPSSLWKLIKTDPVYQLAGRLAPGTSPEETMAALDAITSRLSDEYKGKAPVGYERYGIMSAKYRTYLFRSALGNIGLQFGGREQVARLAALFLAAVGLVLLIACGNVANLLLARGLRRQREIAVRLVLGATRGRLTRQLLVESLLLSLLGAAAGLLLAHWGTDVLLALRTGALKNLPVEDIRLDGRALGFTLGLASLTSLVFGLVPTWQMFRVDLNPSLKTDAVSATAWRRGQFTLQNFLVVGQVAACVVLLLCAGLCVRSFGKLVSVDAGFESQNVLVATVALEREKYSNEATAAFIEQLTARMGALPGVVACATSDEVLPLGGQYAKGGPDTLEGFQPRPGERISYVMSRVGPGYFHMLGIPVVAGREIDLRDLTASRGPVAVVNQSFVRRYWPNQNPLGKRIDKAEVIGVVHDIRMLQLGKEPEPQVFFGMLQGGEIRFSPGRSFILLLKLERPLELLVTQLQHELNSMDSTVKLVRTDSLEHIRAESLAGPRGLMQVLTVLGVGAMVIAGIGLYGVLAYSVIQRTKEIGVRIAIGARPRDVQWLTLRQGMGVFGIGLVLGVLVAALVTRSMQAWLYGTSSTDAGTFLAVSCVFSGVAALACWLPARRAAKVDPIMALRAE
jgi:predicted permease